MRGTPPHLRAAIAAALTLALTALGAAPASAATEYWITGRGWGHGIGMSQYGAQGFAKQGYTSDQIIRYYYQGVTIGTAPADAASVDVLLVSGRAAASFEVDAAGVSAAIGADSWELALGDVITTRVAAGGTTLERNRAGTMTVLAKGSPSVVTLSGPPGGVQTRFSSENGAYGRHYRGSLRIHRVGGTLSVVNRVPLEQYLWGVVPAEMPPSWHNEALEAQSIAARSYAIATRSSSGIYDMHSDTRSQVYRGIEEEEAPSTAAINATAGQVAMHAGKTIAGFFFSTSGGRTASIEDVWNSDPRPYLKTVADPHEKSPYTRWPEHRALTPKAFSRSLGGYLQGSLKDVRVSTNKSARAENVKIVGSGGTRDMAPSSLQFRLGLRSTWFRIERLAIVAARGTIKRGERVALSGTIPTGGKTFLFYRAAKGGTWIKLGQLKPKSGGAWRKPIRPPASRVYRLQRNGHFGPAVAISVRQP